MSALLRRLLLRWLPDDEWSREFVAELDAEHRRIAAVGGRLRAELWYVRQVLSPETWRFVRMTRRRARGTRGTETGGGWTQDWFQEVRHTVRSLAREPRLAVFVVLTLALGIGGTAAMFGLVDRLFLSGPAHVEAPEELVRLYLFFDESDRFGPRTHPWIPYRTAEAVREGTTQFTGVTLFKTQEVLVRAADRPRVLQVSTVGPAYFDLLGVSPAAGRLLGGDDRDAAVISHELWTTEFGADPGVIGRAALELPGLRPVIVGVAPPGFAGPTLEPIDVWMALDPLEAANSNWSVLARLPGAADRPAHPDAALAEANRLHAATDPGRSFQWAVEGAFVSAPLGSDDAGQELPEAAVSRLLAAVAGLVLLIGMANVVNLLLARQTRRRRELAVRMALGVGRWRLTRLLVSESLTLAVLGGLAALPVAWGGGMLVRRVLLPNVAWPDSPLEGRVLVITLVVTLLTGVIVGILPARHAGRTDVSSALRPAGRGGGRGRAGLHLVLAASQVTLSAALLVAAGLFLRSFWTLRVTDLGMDADRVVAVTFRSLDRDGIPRVGEGEHALYRRALDAIEGHPDVADAAVSLGLPLRYNFGMSFAVEGRDSVPALPGGGPYITAVSPSYFSTLGTDIVRGRAFTQQDVDASLDAGPPGRGAPPDAGTLIVSESMARTLWPDQEPLGRCVRIGSAASPCSRVIGVAEDVHRVGYREPPSFQYYVPLAPSRTFGGMVLLVRPHDPGEIAPLRSRLLEVDPAIDHIDAKPLDAPLDPQVRPWRLGSWVLGTAALLALLVALVGVYGVLSYLVEQRRREMGIRIALGATATGIRGLVLRTGLGATAVGLGLGAAVVIASGPWLRPLLFETEVTDPLVLAGVSALLLGAATLACLQPAARAARVEPALCLKEE